MDEDELLIQDNTSSDIGEDSGAHGSDFIEQPDIDTGINIDDGSTSHSDFVHNPYTDPLYMQDVHLGFKDFEQASGIRYVAEGNTGDDLEKLRLDLEQAERDELVKPSFNYLTIVLGILTYAFVL